MDDITPERRIHRRRAVRFPLVYERGGRSFWSVTEDLSLGAHFFIAFIPHRRGNASSFA